jgi:hypothetical protein
MPKDRNAQLRNLITGYGDSIRLSDIKANIAVLFVAIMMGTVIQYSDRYPSYLNLPVLLAPFLFIFLNLLVSVYPRYPRAGRRRFPISRDAKPQDFDFLADVEHDAENLPRLCAMFSRILFWKTITLQTAYIASMITILGAAVLVFAARNHG